MIPNCAATRHAHFTLTGEGPALQTPPDVDQWPDISWEPGESVRRVNLDTVTREDIHTWKPGETLLLSGTMLTGRDAAHKRMTQMLEQGESPLPVDLAGKFIYYVGPVDPVRDEGRWPRWPDYRHPHGQVHGLHSRSDGTRRDDWQGRSAVR